MSLSADILRSWAAPRAVIRARLAAADGERSSLFYLMLGCVLIFVAQIPRLSQEAASSAEIPFEGLLAGTLFGWLFIAPLFFYLVAGLLALVLHVFRAGTQGWAVRLGVFWAVLAVAPLVLVQGALAVLAGPGVVAMISGLVVLAVFVVNLVAGLLVALEAAQVQA